MNNTKVETKGQMIISSLKEAFNFKNIGKELLALKLKEKIFLSILIIAQIIVFSITNKFDVVSWFGLATGIITMINLVLVNRGFITNYFWGLLSTIVWLGVSLSNHLFGDIYSQLFYLVMQFVGIYFWYKELKNENQDNEVGHSINGRDITLVQSILAIIFTIVIYSIVYYTSSHAGGSQVLLDSSLLPLAIIGQVLMTYGYKSQWYAWILLDMINVVIWFNQFNAGVAGASSMFVLQIMMLLNAFYGAYLWFKKE